jgi:hypothetical protein
MSIEKDFAAIDKVISAKEARAQAALLQAYKKALTGIRSDVAQLYAKYEVNGILTYTEMMKYNRLNSLFNTVADQIKDMTGETHRLTRGLASDVYQEAFYRTGFVLEVNAKVALGFTVLKNEAIQASVQNPLSGLTLNERLAANRAAVTLKLREQITQGMIRGESYGDVAKRLKGVLEGDATKALRVASTETHRNYMQGIVDADEKAGESGLKTASVWVASLDSKTRDSHADMDGQEADEDGLFTLISGDNQGAQSEAPGLFGLADEDINCRCTKIIVIKGYEPELRRVRDEGVVDYKTYNEWYKEKVAA